MNKKGDKIHRRYSDDKRRQDDLGLLAVCNNLGAPQGWQLTSVDTEVTCKRCRRIMLQLPVGRVLP